MKIIEYTILKYRYSFHLGEQINIGILFFNHELNKLRFIHPNSLSRVTNLYGFDSTIFLRKYIRSFESQTEKLNKKLEPSNDTSGNIFSTNFEDIIQKYYLIPDASSVVFSKINSIPVVEGIEYEIYKELFPFNPLVVEEAEIKKNEEYISNKFKDDITSRISRSDFNRYFEHNVELSTDLLTEKFEYGWKNGTRNLVTPISFDLSKTTAIKDKSLRWTVSLNLLKEKAQSEGIKFDLLISQPDNPRSDVREHIRKAVERFRSVNDDVLSLYIGEDSRAEYAQYTIDNLDR